MQMNEAELEMIGFSQLSAILEHNKMEEVRKLPGLAGGHDSTGQPQPYNFKPQRIHDQMIEASTSDYLRVDAHLGDSGSPIFLEDGRVGGLVTEVDLGLSSAGTKVTPASAIVAWLLGVFRSNESLQESWYSLKGWIETDEKRIYNALNPEMCLFDRSCIPNVRIAAELEAIPIKRAQFEAFSKEQLRRLRCPLYTAAITRGVQQADFLKDRLKELGVIVVAQGYVFTERAHVIVESEKYTTYTKNAALELAEASVARDIDALWQREPTIITGAICNSSVGSEESEMIQFALEDYLKNFRRAGGNRSSGRISATCPPEWASQQGQLAPVLKQIKDLTAMISDIKVHQSALAASVGNRSDVAVSAAALAAVINAGEKKGSRALIDLGDSIVRTNPEVAAGIYAKSFVTNPSNRAVAGFGEAVSRSPSLLSKIGKGGNAGKPSELRGVISSFATTDSNAVATMTADPGLRPGAM